MVAVAVAASLGLALITAVVWPREREPEYRGKKLSEWIDIYAVQKRMGVTRAWQQMPWGRSEQMHCRF